MDSGDGSTPGSTPTSDRNVRTFTEDEEEWQEPEYAQYVLSDDDAGMWGDDDDEEESKDDDDDEKFIYIPLIKISKRYQKKNGTKRNCA